MVGATGFEPVTTRTPSVCATRLRYAPTMGSMQAESNIPSELNQFRLSFSRERRAGRTKEHDLNKLQESNFRRDSKSFRIFTRALLYFCSESGSLSWSFSSFLVSFNFLRAPSMVKPSV